MRAHTIAGDPLPAVDAGTTPTGCRYQAATVLVINPTTRAIDTTSITAGGANGDKWVGIAFAPNVNKVFCSPYAAWSVLVVDCATNATSYISVSGPDLGSENNKYTSIAYAPSTGNLCTLQAH
jgi:hypothetical protein